MGAFGALIVGLFTYCFKKLNKQDTIKRISTLLVIAVIILLISVIMYVSAETKTDSEGAWFLILFYLLIFGWRLIADAVLLLRGKLEDKKEPENKAAEKKSERKMTTIDTSLIRRK